MTADWDSIDIEACRALVDEADNDPAAAVEQATELLDGVGPHAQLTPKQAVCAWALGLGARHLRQLELSHRWLTRAADALPAGSDDHTGVELTRASTLVYQGKLDDAVQVLEATAPSAALEPRVVCQLATIHEFRGELALAEAGYLSSLDGFRQTGDQKGEAHALVGLGLIDVSRGRIRDAVVRFGLARSLYVALGNEVLAAVTRSNLGYAAARGADLVTALEHLSVAGDELRALGEPFAETVLEHGLVLLGAGLPGEAIEVIAQVLPRLEEAGSNTDRAEVLVTAGRSFAAAGRATEARGCLRTARSLFAHQGREPLLSVVDLRLLELDLTSDPSAAGPRALRLADRMADERYEAAADALLLAARAAYSTRDRALLDRARTRLHDLVGPDLRTALVDCLALELSGAYREALAKALPVLERSTAGDRDLSLDLRAAHRMQFDELFEIALRAATKASSPADVTRLVRVSKSTLLDFPDVIPEEDDLGPELRAALRDDIEPATWRSISEKIRRVHGPASESAPTMFDPLSIDEEVIVLVEADDRLLAVRAGPTGDEFIGDHDRDDVRVALHDHLRLITGAIERGSQRRRGNVAASAESIQQVLPWLVADRLDLMACGALANAPWASVASCPVRMIVDTRPRRSSGLRNARLIARGPSTLTGRDEAELIAAQHFDGDTTSRLASPADVLDLAPSLELLHLACHADHDHENPLLSGYQLEGGWLRGYEIERLRGAPRVVISSACRAGQEQPRGRIQMLGLPATWLAAGSSVVIAPLLPIPDDSATVETMAMVHSLIATGVPAESAVFEARKADEIVARSLVTLGRLA